MRLESLLDGGHGDAMPILRPDTREGEKSRLLAVGKNVGVGLSVLGGSTIVNMVAQPCSASSIVHAALPELHFSAMGQRLPRLQASIQ